jgi:CRISPR-associated endonuclease/helicase Cas3
MMTFEQFFSTATRDASRPSGNAPYDYQRRVACGEKEDKSDTAWLQSGTDCASKLIEIPTGLGKTAAVVLAWVWNRFICEDPKHDKAKWPRRFVYCLPMRTLVEQTAGEVQKWLGELLWDGKSDHEGKVGLHILMGGEDSGDWDIHPEREAILIGTQDMLLSRALNRGYGMSRYRWPIHFGLLNNDCLWVMDETQLMGPGLGTACQLEAFRGSNTPESVPRGCGSIPDARSVTWYMSATSSPEHLQTREWRDVPRAENFIFGLSPAEKVVTSGPVHQRRFAVKGLELQPDSNFGDSKPSEAIIAAILSRHRAMLVGLTGNATLPARTLIICNTVDRAVSVHAALTAAKLEGCDLLLLHSRFRPPEREAQMKRLKSTDLAVYPKGQIVVATQVIEAGVDLSSAVLWSEVAPLASLVQRLGRLNRHGEFPRGGWAPVSIIIGVGVEPESGGKNEAAKQKIRDDNAKRCLPYELAVCETAWQSLAKLNGSASPASFETIRSDVAASIPRCLYSLQRHELMDFFDTDANLSLGFTDVSPFVRGLDEDTDVQVLWRDGWPQDNGKPDFTPDFRRDELCSVPIGKAFRARAVLDQGWLWRGKDSRWISVRDSGIAPGMTILLPSSAGGYDVDAGWTGEAKDNKHPPHYKAADEPSDEDFLSCLANGWQSIGVHTAAVAAELAALLKATIAEGTYADEHDAFIAAVPWHDIGKNHAEWQQAVVKALTAAGITGKDEHLPFAKFSLSESPTLGDLTGKELKREVNRLRHSFRPGIAHEVASALAFRQSEQARIGKDRPLSSLLTEYLIMMHHGRVRKVLRDEIPRFPHDAKDNDTVRGVVVGSSIPTVTIDGKSLGCTSLSTDCRRMGRDASGNESFTRAVLRLLESYGPFQLAYFEAVFRAADVRASKAASEKPNA